MQRQCSCNTADIAVQACNTEQRTAVYKYDTKRRWNLKLGKNSVTTDVKSTSVNSGIQYELERSIKGDTPTPKKGKADRDEEIKTRKRKEKQTAQRKKIEEKNNTRRQEKNKEDKGKQKRKGRRQKGRVGVAPRVT